MRRRRGRLDVRVMEGVVTIVQESRFQLTDDGGVSHLFLLGPNTRMEPDQLGPLQRDQARVRVRYHPAGNVIAHVATRLERL